jgi:putative transposase
MPQSFAAVFIHAVFSTKGRTPIIEATWRHELFAMVGSQTNRLGCQTIIVGGVADHVHLLFGLSRTVTIADTMMEIKKWSSKWVNQHHSLAEEFHWQAGYGSFSVSQSNVDKVQAYIQNQESHHRTQSFQDEFRELLKRHGMSWDERYVWE